MPYRKNKTAKSYDVISELKKVEHLFRELENDKSLPTFGEHFVFCLLSGFAEQVNLKKLYPKTYRKLNLALKRQSALISKAKQQTAHTPTR